ncbi:hypothetical protein L9F63_013029, partial [Diploptera punctata]
FRDAIFIWARAYLYRNVLVIFHMGSQYMRFFFFLVVRKSHLGLLNINWDTKLTTSHFLFFIISSNFFFIIFMFIIN